MILITDSGSTKADWILIDDSKVVAEYRTDGLNPILLSSQTLLEKILAEKQLIKNALTVSQLYFFGAGCGNEEGKDRMVSVLTSIFPSAKISVENDLMAAAIATCGNEKGIVCILGTGSNCCYYDGKKIHRKNFGIGYILGDEGSGAYFGRYFLRNYLYGQMPKELSDAFFNEYHLTFESIIENVYKKPGANIFLASFMPFISKHSNLFWVKNLFEIGVEEFFETNVLSFSKEHTEPIPVHFVGSVAEELKDIILGTGSRRKLLIGKIIKHPKEGLINYFLKKPSEV